MDWSGAKNWLIVLFLGINIFLVITLVRINTQSSVIDKQTISDTVEILKKSDISVDASVIPDTLPKLGSIDVYNSISEYEETAAKILGDNMHKSGENIFISGSKRVGFGGDVIYFSDDSPTSPTPINADNAQSYCVEILRSYGFNMDNATTSITQNENAYNVFVCQKFDRYALIDSCFSINLSENGITSFEGSWFSPTGEQTLFSSDSGKARSIVTVLFEFVRDSARESAGSNKIVQIDLGYITGAKQTYHKYATAMPMWRIRCSDNNEYYYDAR